MAHAYSDQNGVLLRFTTAEQESSDPLHGPAHPPAGTAFTLAFDETANPGIVTGLQSSNFGGYTMPGGTLTVGGVAATVNAPATNAFPDAALVASAVAKLVEFPVVDHLTTAEQEAIFRDHLRRSGQIAGGQ